MDLFGLLNATVPTVVDFAYNASTHAATWRFDNWWYADQYMLTLSDEVTDATGNQLDGEWVNPFAVTTTSAAVSEFPSGDGEAGGGFAFLITRLIGDANHSNVANSADYAIVLANLGMLTGATYSQGDFNGDGDVDNEDLALVIYAWNYSLESANWRRADLNFDGRVDQLDTNIISLHAGMTGAAWQDGDVNYDGQITRADLDLAFGQCGPWWDWYETAA